MAERSRFLDDAARVAGGALETAAGVRREIEDLIRHRIDRMLSGRNLVTREELETVREMAVRAQDGQARLEARIAELEAKVEAAPPAEPADGDDAGDS